MPIKKQKSKNDAHWPNDYPDPSWFIQDRFGMFIHFGLYSIAARHEWVMTHEQMSPKDYRKYFDHFNPDLFNADEWVEYAKNAGMKYLVITTKHHDGFALWDTKLTDYKITNTPFGRDLLAELVQACRKENIKIGFYHSLIDWHHPDFPLDGHHPQREDKKARAKNKQRSMKNYVEFLHGQVRELLEDYGKIDYIWFDFNYPEQDWGWAKGKGPKNWQSKKLEEMILDLQPHIIINDRLGLNRGVTTPEQYQPSEPLKENEQTVIWEACQTFNGSWGYDPQNLHWKSSEDVIKMLIDTVSKDGNLLFNIGPNGRGEFDQPTIKRLDDISDWMRLHERSIIGTGHSQYKAPADCRLTQKENRLYLHIFSWPFGQIQLKGLAGKVSYAQFLHDASEVQFTNYSAEKEIDPALLTEADKIALNNSSVTENSLVFDLPTPKPEIVVPVIEIFLE
ncbi:MAG: alpha-L-fucosidase [Atopostipes sp.]|nr:alpha-L-fucosidase [Atopostipes sp.]